MCVKLVKYGANHANLCRARKKRCTFEYSSLNTVQIMQICVKLVEYGADLRKPRKIWCKSYRKLVKYGANVRKARKMRCKFALSP